MSASMTLYLRTAFILYKTLQRETLFDITSTAEETPLYSAAPLFHKVT